MFPFVRKRKTGSLNIFREEPKQSQAKHPVNLEDLTKECLSAQAARHLSSPFHFPCSASASMISFPPT